MRCHMHPWLSRIDVLPVDDAPTVRATGSGRDVSVGGGPVRCPWHPGLFMPGMLPAYDASGVRAEGSAAVSRGTRVHNLGTAETEEAAPM